MSRWTAFPYPDPAFEHDAAGLRRHWSRLHAGDAEPWPADPAVRDAWIHFHAGRFQAARDAGLAASGAGVTVANKAQCIQATYLEPSERQRLLLLLEAAERAEAQQSREPDNPNAWYWQAYALGRYAQGITVARALAQGTGGKVKAALERAIELAPGHADAHIALGTYHAEVIDKVGKLLGRTQGADIATGIRLFRQALKLNPGSAIARVEFAAGLLMLEGEARLDESRQLLAAAAASVPADAMERLDVERARAELED